MADAYYNDTHVRRLAASQLNIQYPILIATPDHILDALNRQIRIICSDRGFLLEQHLIPREINATNHMRHREGMRRVLEQLEPNLPPGEYDIEPDYTNTHTNTDRNEEDLSLHRTRLQEINEEELSAHQTISTDSIHIGSITEMSETFRQRIEEQHLRERNTHAAILESSLLYSSKILDNVVREGLRQIRDAALKEANEPVKEDSKTEQYLEYVKTFKVWSSKEKLIHVSEMTTEHILNAEKIVQERFPEPIRVVWKEIFIEELKRRNIEIKTCKKCGSLNIKRKEEEK